jgi:hypothetical protein
MEDRPMKIISTLARSAQVMAGMCALVSVAHASCTPESCYAAIQKLYLNNSGIYIQLEGGYVGLTNCTLYSGVYMTLPTSNPNYNSYYAALLAKQITKEPVTIRTVDASTNCAVSYITMQ